MRVCYGVGEGCRGWAYTSRGLAHPYTLGTHLTHFPAPRPSPDWQSARPSLPPDPAASGPRPALFLESGKSLRPGVSAWIAAWSPSTDLLCVTLETYFTSLRNGHEMERHKRTQGCNQKE